MSGLKKIIMWLYMLNKRLYKKPSFIAILLFIVIITAFFSISAKDESHVLRISVYGGENNEDYISSLNEEDGIILYEQYDSKEDAIYAVTNKGYDCAWILPDDIVKACEDYLNTGKPFAEIVQRDDNVFLRLAKEKFFATVYPYLSESLYNKFINDNIGELDEDKARELYEDAYSRGDVVNIHFANSSDKLSDINLVVGPVRGLLAVTIFLAAYSALMNFKKDKRIGMYGRISSERHTWFSMLNIFLSSANAAVIALVSFSICGLFSGFVGEIVYMLIYLAASMVLCQLICELTDRISVIGSLMPILSILMLVSCPIFLNAEFGILQKCIPAYYYLSMFSNSSYIWYLMLYILIVTVLIFCVRLLKRCAKCISRT